MFEAVEGTLKKIDKKAFDKREAKLRTHLLEMQYRVLQAKRFPVVILINGVSGAGKSETVNLLTEWMDPRHIHAHAVAAPTGEELERPPMYRFWRKLPAKGKIGVFFGSWYTQPIVAHACDDNGKKVFEASLDEIKRFETMLAKEGVLLVKYWFHLSKKAQKKRFEDLAADKSTAWRVTKEDWKDHERCDEYRRVSERALARTWSDEAPWTLVDGRDERGRVLFVGETLLSAMKDRLAVEDPKPKPSPVKGDASLLSKLDLSLTVDKKDYEKKLTKLQRRLALLTREKKFKKLSPILVFEGADAAGKGGAIRRITRALDARIYEVIPVAAPTDEEKAQPYLWRFWRHAPRDGKIVIFDRSWYGRVLVERVEGFCTASDWKRAYAEINDFEQQLVEAGCPIAKFWLQISPDEQLRRFKEREHIAWKKFKITDEDWRNREKWDAYQIAASEMIAKTDEKRAHWTVVAAEDKHHARLAVLETVCDTIERAL
jgi:AMP-polyphosphate phosphotransferase